MNQTIGVAGVMLGLSASILGVVTLAYALLKKRPHLQALAVPYTALILAGAVATFFAM